MHYYSCNTYVEYALFFLLFVTTGLGSPTGLLNFRTATNLHGKNRDICTSSMWYSNYMFHYTFKAEFFALVSLKKSRRVSKTSSHMGHVIGILNKCHNFFV